MASIRTRITASYTLAFAGTMFAFSAAVWAERRQGAEQDLVDRATVLADLGVRILRQAGVQSEQTTIKTDTTIKAHSVTARDSIGRELNPRYTAQIDALPSWEITPRETRRAPATPVPADD